MPTNISLIILILIWNCIATPALLLYGLNIMSPTTFVITNETILATILVYFILRGWSTVMIYFKKPE